MAKWCGKIGFAEINETSPGIHTEEIIIRKYYGDVTRNSRRLQSSENLNDDINISNEISIVADPYAELNFHKMRYAEFMGAKWKITNVEHERPRLKLSVGGLYNG